MAAAMGGAGVPPSSKLDPNSKPFSPRSKTNGGEYEIRRNHFFKMTNYSSAGLDENENSLSSRDLSDEEKLRQIWANSSQAKAIMAASERKAALFGNEINVLKDLEGTDKPISLPACPHRRELLLPK